MADSETGKPEWRDIRTPAGGPVERWALVHPATQEILGKVFVNDDGFFEADLRRWANREFATKQAACSYVERKAPILK